MRAGSRRDEIGAMFEKRHPQGLAAPQRMAIAHHLIRYWFEESA